MLLEQRVPPHTPEGATTEGGYSKEGATLEGASGTEGAPLKGAFGTEGAEFLFAGLESSLIL